MLSLTKQERTVLVLFVAVMLSGSILHAAFKKYPHLYDIVNLIDSDVLYSKVDINTASLEELVGVPYIGEYTANSILRYRQSRGSFHNLEELKNIKGIREKNYKKFIPYLKL